MEMLEKAARALCEAQSGVDCYDDLEPEAQERARGHAAAVLQAIREPSEAMVAAGIKQAEECTIEWSASSSCIGEHCWQAMIDAALAEGGGDGHDVQAIL